MDLQKFLDEAMERGEKIKTQMVEGLLNSRFVNQLLKNEKFLNTVVAILNAKSGIERRLHKKLNFILKSLELPTRDDVHGMEKKIHRLENEIETVQRRMMTQRLRHKAAKAVTHKKKR